MDYIQQQADIEDVIGNLQDCIDIAKSCGMVQGVDLLESALEDFKNELKSISDLAYEQYQREMREMNADYERMVL